MATVPNSPSAPLTQPMAADGSSDPQLSRFEDLMERIRGTVTIHGDIVSRDPELWDCERE